MASNRRTRRCVSRVVFASAASVSGVSEAGGGKFRKRTRSVPLSRATVGTEQWPFRKAESSSSGGLRAGPIRSGGPITIGSASSSSTS